MWRFSRLEKKYLSTISEFGHFSALNCKKRKILDEEFSYTSLALGLGCLYEELSYTNLVLGLGCLDEEFSYTSLVLGLGCLDEEFSYTSLV